MSKKINRGHIPYHISQNFLTSTRTIDRLLGVTDIQAGDHVLEIGAGKGHITRRLLARHCHTTAVEIDPALHGHLREKLDGENRLRLIHGDFLEVRLPSGPYKVFSNIPFSITSDIMRKLTQATNPPGDCWLIMEKGAAKRFCGIPSETIASLMLKPYFDVRIVYHLRREDFHPMPSVDIVMLHLHKKEAPAIALQQRPQYERFLRAMGTGTPQKGRPLSHRQMCAALKQAGHEIPQSATLSYVQWLCLFRWWARFSNAKPCRGRR